MKQQSHAQRPKVLWATQYPPYPSYVITALDKEELNPQGYDMGQCQWTCLGTCQPKFMKKTTLWL